MARGPRPAVRGPRHAAHGPQPAAHVPWPLARGPWAHGPRPLVQGPRPTAPGPRPARRPAAHGPEPTARGLRLLERGLQAHVDKPREQPRLSGTWICDTDVVVYRRLSARIGFVDEFILIRTKTKNKRDRNYAREKTAVLQRHDSLLAGHFARGAKHNLGSLLAAQSTEHT